MKHGKVNANDLHTTKRKLPHWQIGGSWYFITFRTNSSFILTERLRNIVVKSIIQDAGKTYDLSIAVVMPDHVHMIIRPVMKDEKDYITLAEIVGSVKGSSARKINLNLVRNEPFWQKESFDRIIRDESEWRTKCDYVRNNPVNAGLVETPEEYQWLVDMENSTRMY